VNLPFGLAALEAIASDAAALARRVASGPLDVARKADDSPVTAVDREVNALLEHELMALLPGSAWLSEESPDDPARLDAAYVWIVDPIDGTKQLVRGVPEVAISIGLVASEAVVAAAIVNPMTGERGAWVHGAPPVFHGFTRRAAPPSLETATAIVSRSETEDGELSGTERLVGATRAVGSVAYKLLRVAAGADTLTYSIRPKSEWDVCAGAGLVQAAGLTYLRLDGAPVRFNQADTRILSGTVAGPEPLASALRQRLLSRTSRT
jgi:myo-inositol-1(or 4)-monophosphatase